MNSIRGDELVSAIFQSRNRFVLCFSEAPWWQVGGGVVPGPGYGAIVALDPATGDQKWEFRRDDAVFTAGVLSTASLRG